MSPAATGLLDTSVLVAMEAGRRLDRSLVPDRSAVSVVTLAELRAGVLATDDPDSRSQRLRTLDELDDVEVLDIDPEVAVAWAELRAHVGRSRRRVNVNDLWIAATAVSHALPLITRDADFDPVDGVAGLIVIRV